MRAVILLCLTSASVPRPSPLLNAGPVPDLRWSRLAGIGQMQKTMAVFSGIEITLWDIPHPAAASELQPDPQSLSLPSRCGRPRCYTGRGHGRSFRHKTAHNSTRRDGFNPASRHGEGDPGHGTMASNESEFGVGAAKRAMSRCAPPTGQVAASVRGIQKAFLSIDLPLRQHPVQPAYRYDGSVRALMFAIQRSPTASATPTSPSRSA